MKSNLAKIALAIFVFAITLFLSCADNQYMEYPSIEELFPKSSSSEAEVSLSYAESSSSVKQSSSSTKSSSSFIVPSSSSKISSSSNSTPSSNSDLCTDFVDGTKREHYGKEKEQFCDSRDGNKYVYVTIGDGETAQTWMAENLKYNATGSKCVDGAILIDGNTTTCDTYGRLYNWATAMVSCPSGWHLPSNVEWNTLITEVGGVSTAKTKLKATSGWDNGTNGTDDYGFSALPGRGECYPNSYDIGVWWSSTENNTENAYYWYMHSSVANNSGGKSKHCSVRCIQNEDK